MNIFYQNTFGTDELEAPWSGNWIDLRDTALAHVLALEVEEAKGKRLLVADTHKFWQEIRESIDQFHFRSVWSEWQADSGQRPSFIAFQVTSSDRRACQTFLKGLQDHTRVRLPMLPTKDRRLLSSWDSDIVPLLSMQRTLSRRSDQDTLTQSSLKGFWSLCRYISKSVTVHVDE